MARKQKKTRRRRFTGWNATNLLEGYLQASVLTGMAFKATPAQFLLGNPGPSSYLTGSNVVSLKEIIDGILAGGTIQGHAKTELQYVMDNIKANWLDAGLKSIGIGIGFKVGRKILSRPRNAANRFIKQLGMGSTVRV